MSGWGWPKGGGRTRLLPPLLPPGFTTNVLVDQHIMTTSRSCGELVEVDVEERIDLHSTYADMDQPYVEASRVVQRAQQGVRDVHPLPIAGHVHHIGLDARDDAAGELGVLGVGDVPLLDRIV